MRIAFLGNFGVDFSSESHHAKTLEALGHEVQRIQEGEYIHAFTGDSLPDLFIWVHTHGWQTSGLAKVIEQMKMFKIPIISYHLDLWFGLEREKDLENDPFYKQLDYFFATDKLMCDWFNENTQVNGVYIPAGVFQDECVILPPSDKNHDVIFVGSKGYHPEWLYRPQLINWLSETYGSRFEHWGGDGKGVVRGLHLNQLYADSKIVVGDTLCLGFDYPYYFSDRLFETTGRGGFLIFPYIKGLEDVFEIGKEIVTYSFGDFEGLKDTIDWYLKHDNEREAIRKAGFKRTKRDHTYLKRWERILSEINKSQ